MKVKLLAWLCFILCSQAFSSSAHETTYALKKHTGSELLEHIPQGKQLQCLNATIIGTNKDGRRGYVEVKVPQVKNAHRGKGGSADINRRPGTSDRSDSPTMLAMPSSVISTSLELVSSGFLLVFLLFF